MRGPWERGREGKGLPFSYAFLPWLPLVRLRHRNDAPSLLLLGILATETQKRMKEEESKQENEMRDDGKQKSRRDRCCRLEWSSGDMLKAGPPDVAERPEGPRVPKVRARKRRGGWG